MNESSEKTSFWQKLWRKPKSKWMIGIPLGGFLLLVIGIAIPPIYTATMHISSTNEFCFSCHIGTDTVVEEYMESIHYKNEYGIIATCADCHISKELVPMMVTKVGALKDVYHHITGKITLDNFEDHRPLQAETVWKYMRKSDSRECRTCHVYENMANQSRQAQRKHSVEFRGTKTCIDCHQGVAHALPVEDLEDLFSNSLH